MGGEGRGRGDGGRGQEGEEGGRGEERKLCQPKCVKYILKRTAGLVLPPPPLRTSHK